MSKVQNLSTFDLAAVEERARATFRGFVPFMDSSELACGGLAMSIIAASQNQDDPWTTLARANNHFNLHGRRREVGDFTPFLFDTCFQNGRLSLMHTDAYRANGRFDPV